MAMVDVQNEFLGEATRESLLQQLQEIWDDIGESDEERAKMLLELEQESLDGYRNKIDQATNSRVHLRQALADARSEFSNLVSILGERTFARVLERCAGTIKEQLSVITPILEQLQKKKEERIKEFTDVQREIQKLCREIANTLSSGTTLADDSNLSMERLCVVLQELRKVEMKIERLDQVKSSTMKAIPAHAVQLQDSEMLDVAVHACKCQIRHCPCPNCLEFKSVYRHAMQCRTRASGGCYLCKRVWRILQLHAGDCKESECHVPSCKDLKQSDKTSGS